jgi:hypothetical protein
MLNRYSNPPLRSRHPTSPIPKPCSKCAFGIVVGAGRQRGNPRPIDIRDLQYMATGLKDVLTGWYKGNGYQEYPVGKDLVPSLERIGKVIFQVGCLTNILCRE